MKLLYLVESGKSKFLVFDEMPDKISTKYGDDTIIGRIGGIFYDFLAKRNERREAFGGRKFDIVLDNGEVEKCEGQWWDAVTDRAREELEKEGNSFSEMMLIGICFLEAAEGYPVDVDLETQGFYRCNDAGTLPGECADFIFHKCND